LSIVQQCTLGQVSRSGFYYVPKAETAENLALMRQIDEQYTRTPFYGVRKVTDWLRKHGWAINPKRVRRLMRALGLAALYPKPRLSAPAAGHRIYPYRLRGLAITRPNQVWATDITYIRLRQGFLYLVAILDWYSRYVVSWEVSVSLEGSFCVAALDWALQRARPEIFNSDQGSQFTSVDFTGRLEHHGILISMDGRGRALDNVFVERLWRTVKYEDIYPEGLRRRGRHRGGASGVFYVLQSRTVASGVGVPDACRSVSGRLRDPNPGHAAGRIPCRSSFLGHPGAKYFGGDRSNGQRKKKGAKKKETQSLWKLTPLRKSSRAGFPQRLGKACDFSTVPTRPQRVISFTRFQEGRSTLSLLIFCPKNGEPLKGRSITPPHHGYSRAVR